MAEKKFIPQKLKIIITIVNRGKGNFFYDQIENLGVNLQLLVEGEGTAPYNLNNLWGLVHKERDVIISFVPEDKVKKILKVLDNKFETVRNGDGIAFSIPISSIIGVAVYQFLVDNRKKKELKK
jgi:nitrogen regulatory protein PII